MLMQFNDSNSYQQPLKLALVTNVDWIRKSAKLFGSLMPTEVMVFDVEDLEDAKEWILT